jgi:hypothetical protein
MDLVDKQNIVVLKMVKIAAKSPLLLMAAPEVT